MTGTSLKYKLIQIVCLFYDCIEIETIKALNNAGTGHAGNCELNYTPIKNGSVYLDRAIEVNEMLFIISSR